MSNPERPFVNITPLARRLESEGLWSGFEETQIDKPFSEMNRHEVLEVARAWKTERFALASVIADRVIDRALRTTLTEATPERLPYPHTNVPAFAVYAIQTALIEEFNELNNLINEGCKDPIIGVYIRYWEVLAKNPNDKDMRLPDSHLMGGIRTAIEIMSETYNVIGDVYEREVGEGITQEAQISIARNSFSVISTLASMHGFDFGMVREFITRPDDRFADPQFDPKKFTLEESEAGLRLRLKSIPTKKGNKFAKMMQKLFVDPRTNVVENYAPRERCPALVNYGEGSAIKRLWDVYITL